MFSKLFEKFRTQLSKPERTAEELTAEFDRLKVAYSQIATSDLYQLIKEYYEAKIEINRDILEIKNISSDEDKAKMMNAQAEIRVMRDFINDMEDMKNQYELNNQQSAEIKTL